MRSLIFFLSIIFFFNETQAQQFTAYNRSGITWIMISNSNNSYNSKAATVYDQNPFGITEKYDNNKISRKVINKTNNASSVSLLDDNKIGHEIIDSLFQEKQGVWSYKKLLQRAKYTMTDAQYKEFEATFAGIETMAGRELVDKIMQSNYIIAFELKDIITYKESYDQIDNSNRQRAKKDKDYKFEPVEREWEGFKANINATIYHVQLTDSTIAVLFQDCWADENSTAQEIVAAKAIRSGMRYSLKNCGSAALPIHGRETISAAKSNNYSDEYYFKKMLGSFTGTALLSVIEMQVDAFQVKAPIFSRRPLKVKVGKKEGVKTNRRFIVYEQVGDKAGNVKLKRRGVIRAAGNVVDNRGITGGQNEASKFYQVQGQRLDVGMLVTEKKDLLALQIGGGTHGLLIRADAFLPFGSVKSTKFYCDVNFSTYSFDKDKISFEGEDVDSDVYIWGVGLGFAKEIYFLRNFFIAPFAGMNVEVANFQDSDLNKHHVDEDSEWYGMSDISFNAGGMFGFTIAHRTKLIGAYSFSPVNFDNNKIFGKLLENGDKNFYHITRPDVKINVTLRFEI